MNKRSKSKPPWLAQVILRLVARSEHMEFLIGDLEENYERMRKSKGIVNAKLWYWYQCLLTLPGGIYNQIYWSNVMLKNYINSSFRNLKKQPLFTGINITGLAIGIASSFLILQYISAELSYDKFHSKKDSIYRIVRSATDNGIVLTTTSMPGPADEAFADALPEIVHATKLYRWFEKKLIMFEDKGFYLDDFVFSGDDFFKIFDFKLLSGDPETVLNGPNSIVLSEHYANLFFGEEDPVGKLLKDDLGRDFMVTGVFKSDGYRSHIEADALVTWRMLKQGWANEWTGFVANDYLLVREGTDIPFLEEKLLEEWISHVPDTPEDAQFILQPLSDIHFKSGGIASSLEKNRGNTRNLFIFSAIIVVILIIASINFMNLSTARFSRRAKEIGIRKVVGAARGNLVKQFLTESVMLSGISFLLAVFIIELFSTNLSIFFGDAINLSFSGNIGFLGLFLGLAIVLGLVSGIYPSLFLSRFEPVNIIKGVLRTGSTGASLRKSMVAFQFFITIILIISVLVVFKQLRFINETDLGFSKDRILVSRVSSTELDPVHEPFKNALKRIPGVTNVSITNFVMGEGGVGFTVRSNGMDENESVSSNLYHIDYDFIPIFDINIIEGRNISPLFPADSGNSVLVNETLASMLGYAKPLGEKIRYWDQEKEIIGIVEDFNFHSLHNEIEPMLMTIDPRWITYNVSVKISPDNYAATIDRMETVWGEFFPDRPFEIGFLDENLNALYQNDKQMGDLINYFSLLAIFVACLGLFGLSVFSAEQRIKEIGIRKVLGSSVTGIVMLVIKEMSKIIALAFIPAIPVSYLLMSRWLQDFAYHISLSPMLFIQSAVITCLLVLVTIGYQAVKSGLTNPVKILRAE